MVDAPEQARTIVLSDECLALGCTLLAADRRDARLRVGRVVDGMRLIGSGPKRKGPLQGNFEVASVEDLVAGEPWQHSSFPHAVSEDYFQRIVEQMSFGDQVHLRFTSPLRVGRPKQLRVKKHSYLDAECFCWNAILRRVHQRLSLLGMSEFCPPKPEVGERRMVDATSLVWLDTPYKGEGGRKTLGGVLGKLSIPDDLKNWYGALARAGILGIGENTRFGFGRFWFPQADRHALVCHRWKSLVELALRSSSLDAAAHRYKVSPGVVTAAADTVRQGTYRPDPNQKITIRQRDNKHRVLDIPSRRDRALQVAILETLSPAIDRFLEESSFAYRSGLGRHSAAKHIATLYRDGFRWAVRSDFASFFESVSHEVMRDRLDAYLADTSLSELLMMWIKGSDESRQQGLPTGAPISPVLSNLLLDRFDEAIQSPHTRLVRYADDFLVLFREREQAVAVLEQAKNAAEELCLQLNEQKTRTHQLDEPFYFLGFRFHPDQPWRYHPSIDACDIAELGWHDSKRINRANRETRPSLPGESGDATLQQATVVITGNVHRIETSGSELSCFDRGDRRLTRVPLRRVDLVLFSGSPEIGGRVVRDCVRQQCTLAWVDRSGSLRARMSMWPSAPGGTVLKQAKVYKTQAARLNVSRSLIAAKLRNTAKTARALFPSGEAVALHRRLNDLVDEVLICQNDQSLFGIEGAAASEWYSFMGSRLPKAFGFSKRVKPRATDPGNALLNLVHSHIHSLCVTALESIRLHPGLGVLHRVKGTHAALASDLQESFRHLGDRIVIDLSNRLSAKDFQHVQNEKYPIKIEHATMNHIFKQVYEVLSITCENSVGNRTSYRQHIVAQARDFKHWLHHQESDFQAFQHP